ncbi:MAG: C_GCAxxG_C_C family protein [Dehalococcoidales bacterium]|nr:C_GCAxxG_C_C family protein [Dehalococcoidales bacterium]
MSVRTKEQYRKLTREELLDTAFKLGVDFEKNSGSCSQCTAAALCEILGFEKIIVKAAASSCGGQASQAVGTCGAVVGGTMVLDYYLGRPADKLSTSEKIPANMEAFTEGMETAKLLCQRFLREYQSILCPDIQKRLFGRSYRLSDPDEFQRFEEAGAHSDPAKCMNVVGNSARWVMEILLDKGVVILS